jgi:uncharacterized repeat protein (TIGR01451 family)
VRIAVGLLAAMLLTGLGAGTAAGQETADLQITKIAAHQTVRVGETVTYTVTVTNLGPGTATGVIFGDSIPDQLNLVDSTCGAISAFCTVDSLPSDASSTITIVATPIPNLARDERRISNTAFILQSDTSDPNPSNNQDSAVVRVVGPLSPCQHCSRVRIAPKSINFGSQPVGTEVLQGATITNTSGSDLLLLVEGGLPDDFGFGLLPGSTCPALTPGDELAAGTSCDAVVRFTPSEFFAGLRQTGALTVTVRDPATGELLETRSIKVSGRGSTP